METLPDELLLKTMNYLDQDIGRLAQVNSQMRRIAEDEGLYLERLIREFPGFDAKKDPITDYRSLHKVTRYLNQLIKGINIEPDLLRLIIKTEKLNIGIVLYWPTVPSPEQSYEIVFFSHNKLVFNMKPLIEILEQDITSIEFEDSPFGQSFKYIIYNKSLDSILKGIAISLYLSDIISLQASIEYMSRWESKLTRISLPEIKI